MTPWTTANAVALRAFIEANPAFLENLESGAKRCEGDTNEARANSGSERQGWQDCVQKIKGMKRDPVGSPTDPKFIEPNK